MSDETIPDPSQLKARASNGDPEAMNMLGKMYFDGQGVSKDDDEAVLWFRKAAEADLTGEVVALVAGAA